MRSTRRVEYDHTYLQFAAAVEGLGVTLASLPLIERDIAAGRLVCPIAAPIWHAPDYTMMVNSDQIGDSAVLACERWITAMVGKSPSNTQA